jgi:hypothetical protein
MECEMKSTVEMPLLSARTAQLVGLLRDLRKIEKDMQDREKWSDLGICNRVSEKDLLRSLFPMWPLFSGSPNFPVPSEEYGVVDAFMEATAAEMWDRETSRYAALRWELLEFLIDTLERELERRGQYGN